MLETIAGSARTARLRSAAAAALLLLSASLVVASCSGSDANGPPAPLDHFRVEAAGGGVIAAQAVGVPFAIRVTAEDATGHTVTGFTGTVDLSSSGTLSAGAGTTAAFTAGVLAQHAVTITNQGSFTITATRTGGTQAGASAAFAVDAPPTVVTTSPAAGATAVATSGTITVTFSEPVNATTASFSLACPVGSPRAFTLSATPATAFTLTPTSALPAGSACRLTVNASAVTDADTQDGPDAMAADATVDFTTRPPLGLVDDDWSADATRLVTGNVIFESENAVTPFGTADNDTLPAGATVSFVGTIVGGTVTAGRSQQGGDVTMVTSGGGLGRFTYDPPAGYEGTDRFSYVVTDGDRSDTATVTVRVSGMIWFVDNAAAACTSRAGGCGRLTSPYGTLAALQAENDGAGNDPAPGDNIFLYQRGTAYAGRVTLLAGQRLIGQDATASLSAITGITPSSGSRALPAMLPGDATTTTITGATGAVLLGPNNTVRGLTLAATGGIALEGTGFGSFTHGDLEIAAVNAAAIRLQNGALAGGFRKVSSSNSSLYSAITLAATTGSFTIAGAGTAGSGGTIQGTTGQPGISLTSTGPASLAWMTVQNNTAGGLTATGAAGLTLRQSSFSGNGSSGTATSVTVSSSAGVVPVEIDTVSMTNSYYQAINAAATGGTMLLGIHGATISGTNATSGAQGVLIRNSNATLSVTLSGSSIGGTKSSAFSYDASGSASGQVTVTGNTFDGGTNDVVLSTGGTGSPHSGSVQWDVASNSMSGASNIAVSISVYSAGTGSVNARVRSNTIGQAGVASSCADQGIFTTNGGYGPFVLAVTDNLLHGCAGYSFYHALDNLAGARSDITLARNTMTLVPQAIAIGRFGGVPTADRLLCVDAAANNVTASVNPVFFNTGAVTLLLPGYTGSLTAGTTADADIDSYLRARNTLNAAANMITTTSPGVQQAPASCTQPNF